MPKEFAKFVSPTIPKTGFEEMESDHQTAERKAREDMNQKIERIKTDKFQKYTPLS